MQAISALITHQVIFLDRLDKENTQECLGQGGVVKELLSQPAKKRFFPARLKFPDFLPGEGFVPHMTRQSRYDQTLAQDALKLLFPKHENTLHHSSSKSQWE